MEQIRRRILLLDPGRDLSAFLLDEIGGHINPGIVNVFQGVDITGMTLLPLCLLKNLSGLAPFSLVGIGGMFYTSGAMAIRYAWEARTSWVRLRAMEARRRGHPRWEISGGCRGEVSAQVRRPGSVRGVDPQRLHLDMCMPSTASTI